MNIFKNKNLGFSLVEVLLSGTILALILTAFVSAMIYGQESTMLAGNRNRAVFLAEEGLEAVRNIRDNAYANLVDGTYGLAVAGNIWTFSGSNDLTENFYTRQIAISTIDANRKQITSTVTWQQNPQRTGSVSVTSYLTNWQNLLATSGGLLVYSTSTNSLFRTYDTTLDTFSNPASAAYPIGGTSFVVRTSPTKTEVIAGFITAAGILNVMCYDGSSWTQEWSVNVGGTGSTRRFDIAYETSSGDAMILYSSNAAPTNELAYRTKLGSTGCGTGNWSSVASFDPLRTAGVVHWVKMGWDRRSGQNLIAAIWADANRDLSVAIWNGTAWGNEPATLTEGNLEVVSGATPTSDNFDVEYESLSGDIMLVWGTSVGSGANGVRYRTCPGGIAGCTWSAVTTPATFADDATNLDLSANPNSDEMVFASIGNAQNDLQIGYWSGLTWTNSANVDTSCNPPVIGAKLVATGWLISGSTTRSIVRYADQGSNAIDWYTGNVNVLTKQNDISVSPAATGPIWFDIQTNPQSKDQLLTFSSDSNNYLEAKRLVMDVSGNFTWTNSDANSTGGQALELNLPSTASSPYSFAFWRN